MTSTSSAQEILERLHSASARCSDKAIANDLSFASQQLRDAFAEIDRRQQSTRQDIAVLEYAVKAQSVKLRQMVALHEASAFMVLSRSWKGAVLFFLLGACASAAAIKFGAML